MIQELFPQVKVICLSYENGYDNKIFFLKLDGQDPPYWIQGFDKGGHFTNFTVVIIDELARNFQEVDKAKFNLNSSERITDR